jgi:hypothetical protein
MGMYCEVIAVPQEHLQQRGTARAWETPAERAGCSVNLEKSWHGLHYLLCGSAWEEEGPLAFLLAENETVPDSDTGYGPVRVLAPDRVREVHAALDPLTDEALWSRFDAETMNEEAVYPQIWDESESDLKEEYLFYFRELKALVAKAAARGDSLAIVIA